MACNACTWAARLESAYDTRQEYFYTNLLVMFDFSGSFYQRSALQVRDWLINDCHVKQGNNGYGVIALELFNTEVQ